jgi:hypothetical protein
MWLPCAQRKLVEGEMAAGCLIKQGGIFPVSVNSAVTNLTRVLIEQRKLVEEEIPQVASSSKAVLQLVRLTRDEVGFRPVPLVGLSLDQATPSDIAATVHISQTGLFNTFTPMTDGKTSFVVCFPVFWIDGMSD